MPHWGGSGPSYPQDEHVWRLSQLPSVIPPSQGELTPSSSDSICTEDFAARFQEAMVEAEEQQEEGARARSPESLGGHISRLSQSSHQSLRSWSPQQESPWEEGTAKCSSLNRDTPHSLLEDSSPTLGPAAPGTTEGRSQPHFGEPFPEKWKDKIDIGSRLSRRQRKGLHTGSRNFCFPLSPSHDKRVHWDHEPALSFQPNGPAWKAPVLKQNSRLLAGTQDPRRPMVQPRGRLPASPWDPESLLPLFPLGHKAPGSQKEEPSLSPRKELKKEQDPKPWKWSKKPEMMKDGSPGQLRGNGATDSRHKDSSKSGRQQLMPETPDRVEAPRHRSLEPGLELLQGLIEAARRHLWDVDRQAEALQEAIQELQRNELASTTGGPRVPEFSSVERNAAGGIAPRILACSGSFLEV